MKNILIFTAGAAVGALASWYIVKKKYEDILNEELNSYYNDTDCEITKDSDDISDEESEEEPQPEQLEVKRNSGYVDYVKSYISDSSEIKEPVGVNLPEHIKLLTPDEFGELDEYDIGTLFYHSDGVLCDSDESPIDDVDKWIGKESLKHFGDYEADSVFVRNHNMKMDFEVIYTEETYTELLERAPYHY